MSTTEFKNMQSANPSVENSLEKAYQEELLRQHGGESHVMKYSNSNSKTQQHALGSTAKLMTSTNFISDGRNLNYSDEHFSGLKP